MIGPVSDIATRLRHADTAGMPVRFGGGSRAKVIDVPAHRIPAVSTTLGVEDGHHLLDADTAMAQTPGGDP
jgi:hypothetical protein